MNDMGNVVAGSNNWPLWNNLIHVHIGPTQASVTGGESYEQLVVSPTDYISPGGGSDTYDVNSMPSSYYVYLQAGWWEYFCGGGPCYWTKHNTAVVCCDCSSTCYKWGWIRIDGHTSGNHTIHATDILAPYNWCGSGAPYCP